MTRRTGKEPDMTPLAHAYRVARAYQQKLMTDDAYGLTVYPSGRTERTFGPAPYGEHALNAFATAKWRLAADARRAADQADYRKRSRAAKKGWKTREAAAR